MPIDLYDAQHSPRYQRHHEPVTDRCWRATTSRCFHGMILLSPPLESANLTAFPLRSGCQEELARSGSIAFIDLVYR